MNEFENWLREISKKTWNLAKKEREKEHYDTCHDYLVKYYAYMDVFYKLIELELI